MVHRESTRSVRCVAVLLSSLLILGQGCGDAAPEDTPRAPADPDPSDQTEVEQTEKLGHSEIAGEMGKLKQRKKGKALHEHLTGKGFEPSENKDKDFFGQRDRYKNPDKPNAKITHTIVLQNYHKQGSKDAAALATVTITTKEGNDTQTTTYDFALVSAEGNLEQTQELTATDEGKVVEAHSWWSCTTNRIYEKCGTLCISSVATCAYESWGNWAAYLTCLAVTCGYCLTKAVACCSCDCSWWCKWGAGCCDR